MSDINTGVLATKNNVLSISSVILIYSNTYIEHRRFKDNKLQQATPFSKEDLKELVAEMVENNDFEGGQFQGEIPDGLKYFDYTTSLKMVTAFPEGLYDLVFTDEENNGKYYLPNLCMVIDGDSLLIRTYLKWEGMKTKVYPLPFPNGIGAGGFCQGTAKMNFKDCKTFRDYFEESKRPFFYGKFSHTLKNTVLEHQKNKKSFDYEKWLKDKRPQILERLF